MINNNNSIPAFGVLSGIKVVHVSQSVACPFAAVLMADWGAEVIWIENPYGVDLMRWDKYMIEQDRRNMLSICLDIPSPAGRKIFLDLIKDTDILLESSKGGQFAKWGLTDEVLWEQNPALVIGHISGFGQTGDPKFVKRPCFDPIAQAFSGYMQHNGYPNQEPIAAQPMSADYFTALFATSSTLGAFCKALKTGKGESIDIAQYECMVRVQGGDPARYFGEGIEPVPSGNHSSKIAGWGSYVCKDGRSVYILAASAGVLKIAINELGLEYGSELFPCGISNVFLNTPAGDLFEEKWKAYFASKTAAEAEQRLNEIGVPCSLIMNYEQISTHAHYQARQTFIEWETLSGEKFTGTNIIPRFKNNPGKVWRGCPERGLDNEVVLHRLGLSDEEIQELYNQKVIFKK
jgi:L-carnitine CoA-transferase